jgi:hypothetical protein
VRTAITAAITTTPYATSPLNCFALM